MIGIVMEFDKVLCEIYVFQFLSEIVVEPNGLLGDILLSQ